MGMTGRRGDKRCDSGDSAFQGMGLAFSCSCRRHLLCAFADRFWHSWIRGPEEKSVYLDTDTRIQIVDTMLMLPHAEKDQNAAFIVSWDIIITCPI
jgi:hypothetical protein